VARLRGNPAQLTKHGSASEAGSISWLIGRPADQPELSTAPVLFGQAPPRAGQDGVNEHGFIDVRGHQHTPDLPSVPSPVRPGRHYGWIPDAGPTVAKTAFTGQVF
jgi:hypothetical protein